MTDTLIPGPAKSEASQNAVNSQADPKRATNHCLLESYWIQLLVQLQLRNQSKLKTKYGWFCNRICRPSGLFRCQIMTQSESKFPSWPPQVAMFCFGDELVETGERGPTTHRHSVLPVPSALSAQGLPWLPS